MFYCLAGRTPWEGLADQMGIMMAIMNEEINVTSLPISPEFQRVLARALAGDRDQRFPNAIDLRDAITKTPEWHLVSRGAGTRLGQSGSQPTIPDGVAVPVRPPTKLTSRGRRRPRNDAK